ITNRCDTPALGDVSFTAGDGTVWYVFSIEIYCVKTNTPCDGLTPATCTTEDGDYLCGWNVAGLIATDIDNPLTYRFLSYNILYCDTGRICGPCDPDSYTCDPFYIKFCNGCYIPGVDP